MIELERLAHELTLPRAGRLTRWKRIFSLTRHYRWSQLVRRGWKVTRARLRKRAAIQPAEIPATLEWNSLKKSQRLADTIVAGQAAKSAQMFSDLKHGRLTRLNQTLDIGWPIDWQNTRNQDHLWRFQLHYHEFLLSLATGSPSSPDEPATETEPASAWSLVWSVVESWLDQYPPEKTAQTDDAWHPYCISRRVQVWIWLLALGHPSPTLQRRMLVSLFQQVDHLHGNLEKDLGGNHLLENLTAIALGAAVVCSARSRIWLATVERELKRELGHQILSYGEHFELSPMYHCQVLGCLLRIGWMCETEAPQLVAICRNKAVTMLSFLEQTLHPDEEIALLGDSGFGEAPSVREIRQLAVLNQLDLARSASSANLSSENDSSEQVAADSCYHCGAYWIFRDTSGDFVIFDRGDLAAKGLPAHGHCDLLGFEASVGGRRWFVDSGNFNYESDSMRSYCRSSLAHNVVTLGEQNQADVWSKFRMGDRAEVVDTQAGLRNGFQWASARVTNFPHNKKCCWDRLFAILPGQRVWICADRITESTECVGPARVGFLHLAPEVKLRSSPTGLSTENQRVELSDGITDRQLIFFNCQVQVADGWYCPEFGKRFPNQVLVYRCLDQAHTFGWVMSRLEMSDMGVTGMPDSIVWKQADRTFEFDWK